MTYAQPGQEGSVEISYTLKCEEPVMSSPLMTHQVHLPAIKKAIVWERPLRVQGKDRPLTLLNGTSRYLARFKGPLSYLAF